MNESHRTDCSGAWQKRRLGLILVCLVSSGLQAAEELQLLSLEQLMNVEVTSASRKSQSLGEVAGAIFVISAEDIRRSGVTSVAEALRMVPGVHVGRIDDTRWAVTARGFNDQLANKLLVMVDGRHIYTPDFAGVFWSDHMPLIDNVQRIEVIRGPGASVWGSNAVNGVINIISRGARDTQGLLLQAREGNRDMSGMTARYGGATPTGWYYRFDLHSVEENITDSPLDLGNNDFLQQMRTSFRIDSPASGNGRLWLQGSYYDGESEEVARTPNFSQGTPFINVIEHSVNSRGVWFMANWDLQDSDTSSWNVSSYLERKSRDFSLGEFTQTSFSLELQRQQKIGNNHDVIWGFGTRLVNLPFSQRTETLVELPGYEDDYRLYEFFAQDEIRLTQNLALTLGLKAQRNAYVDWEYQPNVRFSWQYSPATAFWFSASTASRTPSAGERGLQINPAFIIPSLSPQNPGPIPVAVTYEGNRNFESEELTALEFGVKGSLGTQLSYDLSVFDFSYEKLLGGERVGIFCEPGDEAVFLNPACVLNSDYILARSTVANVPAGDSSGVELALQWQPLPNWRTTGAFSWFDYRLNGSNSPGPLTLANGVVQGSDQSEPERIAYIRSEWTITPEIEFDLVIRSVAESEIFAIDSYLTADLRLEWKPRSDLRFELIGQNLLDKNHTEYGSRVLDAFPSRVNSGVIVRISWAP